MKKINQELIALFDKYGSDRRRALRENKKLSYLYALAICGKTCWTGTNLTRNSRRCRSGRTRAR